MSGERIVLGEDDFPDPPERPAAAPTSAQPPPASRPTPVAPIAPDSSLPAVQRGARRRVEAERPSSSGFMSSQLGRLIADAMVGVLLGWGFTEIIGIAGSPASTSFGSDAKSGAYFGLFGVIFGSAIVCSDWVRAGDWDGAGRRLRQVAIPLFAASFVAGFVAEVIYSGIIEGLTLQERLELTPNSGTLYLARMIGWGLFGAGVGAAIGLVNRSRTQAINAGLGGLAGGAAGGLAFEFAGAHLESVGDGTLRLIGLMAIGLLVAVGMRFVETARREAWLEITGGGMAGKEFILYHERTQLGSSPDCEIYLLKDPSIEKFHAMIESKEGRRTLTTLGDAVVAVNGQPTRTASLRSHDTIQIGNTTIRFSERTAGTP